MLVTPAMLVRFLSESGLRASVLSERLYGDSIIAWPPTAETYEERPIYLISSADAHSLDEKNAESRLFAVFSPSWPTELAPSIAQRTIVACQFSGTAEKLARKANVGLRRFAYYLGLLSRGISNQDPIEKLMRTAATYLGLPSLLLDLDFHLIAHSDAEPREACALWHALKDGSQTALNEATDELLGRVGQHFSEGNLPLHLVTEDGCRVLACSVFRPSGAFGYLFLFGEKHRVNEALRDCATILCAKLAAALALEQHLDQPFRSRSEALFAGTIDGSVEDAEALERYATAAKWRFGPHFQVAVFGVPGETSNERFLQRLAQQFSEISTATIATAARGSVAVLFSSDRSEVIGVAAKRQIEGFARSNNLRAGISRSYENFLETAHMYEQAIVAVEQGMARTPDAFLFRFSDFTFSYLRDILSARESLLTFCHPGVIALREYDAVHSSQLVETVRCYLESDKSPSKAAGALSIHRSTLDYRIKHAEEVMGVDLVRADDHFDVWLSLRLLD